MAKLTRYIVSSHGEKNTLYTNKNLAVVIEIKSSMKTSFHCHLKKKTGFIFLSGNEIKLVFMKKKFTKVSKVMISMVCFMR